MPRHWFPHTPFTSLCQYVVLAFSNRIKLYQDLFHQNLQMILFLDHGFGRGDGRAHAAVQGPIQPAPG